MKCSFKTLIIVLMAVMSLAAAQVVQAGEDCIYEGDSLEGFVTAVEPKDSEIWIDGVQIKGFPFEYLERELGLRELEQEISVGDWVSVTYFEEEKFEKTIKKALTLEEYCPDDQRSDCIEGTIVIQEVTAVLVSGVCEIVDASPVNKNPDDEFPDEELPVRTRDRECQ